MEKLKAKHDHKLTDILKVAIFGLMLILPGLILLPSMLYYGVNEYATAPTEQVEKIEYERVNFNQLNNYGMLGEESWNYAGNYTYQLTNDNLMVIGGTNSSSAYLPICEIESLANHQYLVHTTWNNETNSGLNFYFGASNYAMYDENYKIYTFNDTTTRYIRLYVTEQNTFELNSYVNVFDLTKMFGAGNEPTIQQFKQWYPNDFYTYTTSRYEILEKPTGTYETYTDITSQIQYNWNSLWQQPLFSWTNYTILKQGLDNFTYVFGITQTSYLNNLITYELIMVAIYIVIDIILTLFKWLTHLIGEK